MRIPTDLITTLKSGRTIFSRTSHNWSGTYRLGVPWGIKDNWWDREINLKLTISFLLPIVFMLLLAACGGTQPLPEIDATVKATPTPAPLTATLTPAPSNSSFTISSTLCDDEQGPDCTKLRLGDDYLTTSAPAIDYLYSCTDKNPNAPGSIESKITWIAFADKTWDFLKKLWLPQGTFSPATGTYKETISGDARLIEINNLPVDGKIGDWPMTNYPTLTDIDPNPGIPTSVSFSFSYSASPSESPSPTCVSLGAIGVTKNGVVIFNAIDGRGEDAVAREIVDMFGGHPAGSNYHYHFIPERLDNEFLSDGHSGIVGYINDGFPLYGYKGERGVEMTNDDLDHCHGHKHWTLEYHYHATLEYPYTVGCYMGTPISSSSDGGPPPGGQGSNPPPGAQDG